MGLGDEVRMEILVSCKTGLEAARSAVRRALGRMQGDEVSMRWPGIDDDDRAELISMLLDIDTKLDHAIAKAWMMSSDFLGHVMRGEGDDE